MKKNRSVIAIILLTATLIFIYTAPKAAYVGTDFISKLQIPLMLSGWSAKDVSDQVVLSLKDHPDKFSNEVLAYHYNDPEQRSLLFLVLDAGNFHHPNVCFTAAGYKIQELEDTEFTVMGRSVKAHTLFTKKGHESSLSFYWIIINKNIAHEWVEQKIKQVYYSLLNKQRVGLMIRLDIPADENNFDDAVLVAQGFLDDLSKVIEAEQSDYIFGTF